MTYQRVKLIDSNKMATQKFDPLQFGAKPVSNSTFDPTQYGAVAVQTPEPKVTSNVPFPSAKSDTGLVAGAKAVGNLPSSAFNLAKGVVGAVLSPIQTLTGIGNIALGGVGKLIPGQQKEEVAFDEFKNFIKQRYGSLENLQKTATEDPFGFGTDVASLFGGGAALVGRTGEAGALASRISKTATAPIRKTTEAVTQGIGSSARFATSQATGLNPETIQTIIKNPEAFKTPETAANRVAVAQSVSEALDTRLNELSDLGSGYQSIRESSGNIQIPPTTIPSVLEKYGVKLDSKGKIVTSPESRPLSSVDRNSLQDFIDNYGKESSLTPNAFLNTREALSNLSKFEQGKTNLPQLIARDLRKEYDTIGKRDIAGLEGLDLEYAPERQLLGQLKKDIFDAQGELKSGAISKIANLTGKGKEQVLARIKELVPDIEQRVQILKAAEDIEAASGLKIGTYARAGAAVTGIVTGNIPVIIGAILAQPEIAVPLLRGAGLIGKNAAPIVNAIRAIAEDVNNFRIPAPVIDYYNELKQNPRMGLSMQDITVPARALEATKSTSLPVLVPQGTDKETGAKIPPKELDAMFDKAYETYGEDLPRGLLEAVMMQESTMGTNALNRKADAGLYGWLTGITKTGRFADMLKRPDIYKQLNDAYPDWQKLDKLSTTIGVTASILAQAVRNNLNKKPETPDEALQLYDKYYKTTEGAKLSEKQRNDFKKWFTFYSKT
jgi:hypothetical protein